MHNSNMGWERYDDRSFIFGLTFILKKSNRNADFLL